MKSVLHIKIPSLLENIRIVESFIDNARDKFNLNDDIYGNIMVAVTESVNNAIIHGNGKDKEKEVELSLEVGKKELYFTIKDQGKGFDPNSLPDPTAPENLLTIGGRGIFLIKNLADKVDFLDEGRTVKMTFNVTNSILN
ncbi:ATP-binding protein [Bernardetia sp.]|uniref:ATP-binding protein n=1 Tax=Bernardetia sp. TaxID=1937974 RepID=UPI0025BEA0E8|nr:ATP-binding protein [Bernardetia sp.]